jgi:nucleotide-binding universal stress UspA family protein
MSGADSRGQPAASLSPPPPAGRERGDRLGLVLLAYDGSDLARVAIAEAGQQLPARREALVVTVWHTFNVGFVPEPGSQFDAACGDEVRQAAEQTAAYGAALAEAAGFRAQAVAVEGTPAWKAIVDAAEGHAASLIVLGSRRRAGLGGLVAGSVSGDVASRSPWPVLLVQDRDGADARPTNGPSPASSPEDALPKSFPPADIATTCGANDRAHLGMLVTRAADLIPCCCAMRAPSTSVLPREASGHADR